MKGENQIHTDCRNHPDFYAADAPDIGPEEAAAAIAGELLKDAIPQISKSLPTVYYNFFHDNPDVGEPTDEQIRFALIEEIERMVFKK